MGWAAVMPRAVSCLAGGMVVPAMVVVAALDLGVERRAAGATAVAAAELVMGGVMVWVGLAVEGVAAR